MQIMEFTVSSERVSVVAVVIKTFAAPGGKYVYDRQVNSILSVSEEEYAACQRLESDTVNPEDLLLLERYKEQGYFQASRLKKIEHPATAYMPFYLENGVTQITMQITQDCNLRCSYCAYGGGYGNQRTHSKKTMPMDTMKKCVDFIMARSKNVDEVVIGFYGGEPLLEIDKMRECISYIKEKYKGRTVRHTITTNGTCFTDDTIKFLVDNNFDIIISFDGPRELHNFNRVYADGRGSFDDIMDGVNKIKELYPEHYRKVMFLTTVAPNIDLACVSDFYTAEDILQSNSVTLNQVSPFGANDDMVYDDMYGMTYKYQMTKLLLSELGMYKKEKISKLFLAGLATIVRLHSNLSKSVLPEISHPGGPCLPGVMRPFVDVNGNIYPCERVSEGTHAVRIGHIETGFDLDKIKAVLNVGRLTETECINCWCFMHCFSCVAACDNDGKLCGVERLRHCEMMKNTTLNYFDIICLLLENECDFTRKEEAYNA